MQITEDDLYIGSVLEQLCQVSERVLITKKYNMTGFYEINGHCNLLIGVSNEEGQTWQFHFSERDLFIALSHDETKRFYLALVCGNHAICLLTESDVNEFLPGMKPTFLSLRVSSEPCQRLRVQGNGVALSRPVLVDDFPGQLIENTLPTEELFSWPALSTISVYQSRPDTQFITDENNFDLSDLLIKDLKQGERRKRYIGVTLYGKTLEDWNYRDFKRIEDRIHYLFNFENIAIQLNRVSNGYDNLLEREFMWELEYGLDTPAQTENKSRVKVRKSQGKRAD